MKRSKHNVDQSDEGKAKRTYNNILFDSVLEKDYYLYLLENKEEFRIISIKLQPKYLLFDGYIRKSDGKKILPLYYIADFLIEYKDEFNNIKTKVIDTKGNPDSLGLTKRKLFEGLYPDIDFHWISFSKIDHGWIEYDDLLKARKERKKAKAKKGKTNG